MNESTRRLRQAVDAFAARFKGRFKAAFLVGSLVYAEELTEKSDADLVVIIDDLQEWMHACNELRPTATVFKRQSAQLLKEARCDYLCIKTTFEGADFSIDFLPLSTLKAFLERLKTDDGMFKKGAEHPQNSHFILRSGARRLTFPKGNAVQEDVFLINSPLFVQQEQFYFGITLGKFLSGYKTLWSDPAIEGLIEKIRAAGVQRMYNERHIESVEDIVRSLARYERFSAAYAAQLDDEFKKLVTR